MKIYNFLLLTLIFSSLPIKAGENFSGNFDVNNWSTVGSSGDGSLDTNNAPDSITITGPNDGSRGSAQKFFIEIPSGGSGTYSFDWSYTTEDRDGSQYDYPNLIKGGNTSLFEGFIRNFSTSPQSGSILSLTLSKLKHL